MRRLPPILSVLALILLALHLSTAQAGNLVIDGGFESGGSAWKKYGGQLSVVRTPVHGGAQAAKHLHTHSGTRYLYQKVQIKGNTTYHISAWVLHNDTRVKAVWLRLAWYTQSACTGRQSGRVDSPDYTSPRPDWRLLSLSWTAPASAACVSLRLVSKVGAAGAATYWDDVKMSALAPPPSVTRTPTSSPTGLATLTPTASATPTPTASPPPTASPTPTPSRVTLPTSTPSSSPTFTPVPLHFITLNEFLPAPAGTVDWDGDGNASHNDEWVELFNPQAFPVTLSGWVLDDAVGGSAPYHFPLGTTILPGQHLLLFKRTTRIALNNGGDSVRLFAPRGILVDSVTYPALTPTDATSWSRTVDGGGVWTHTYPPSPGAPNRPPTPTPTPLPADFSFRGVVYRGTLGETHTPLGGVRVALYGRRLSGETRLLSTYVSTPGGWFGLHTYADYPQYVLKIVPKAGWQVSGAWSDNPRARVKNKAILYPHPPNGIYVRNFFFLRRPDDPLGAGGIHSLLVQEVEFDPKGTGRNDIRQEWVDIYNPLSEPLLLAGWYVGDASGKRDPLPDFQLPAHGFLTLVANRAAFLAAFPTPSAPIYQIPDGRLGNGLANHGDAFFLYNPLGMVVDGVSWGDNTDALNPAVATGPAGTSIERLPPSRDTDSAGDWIRQLEPAPGRVGPPPATPTPTPSPTPSLTPSPTPSLTPTATASPTTPPTATPSPTPTATVSPSATPTATPSPTPATTLTATPTSTIENTPSLTPAYTVVINEFLPAPAGHVDWDGDGRATHRDEWIELYNPNPISVDLGGWRLDDERGGSPPWNIPARTFIRPRGFLVFYRRTTGLVLNDGGDAVRLMRPDGRLVDQVRYVAMLPDDAFSWSRLADGAPGWTHGYPPSPGRPNRAATPPPPPTPVPLAPSIPPPTPVPPRPVTSLALLYTLPEHTRVIVEGAITLPSGLISPRTFYIGDREGGIRVYMPWRQDASASMAPLLPGASVRITGHLAMYKGIRELIPASPQSILLLTRQSQEHPLFLRHLPRVPLWGMLIQIEGTVERVYRRTLRVRVNDVPLYVYVPRKARISLQAVGPGARYRVTGVMTPWKGDRQLVLRMPADLRLLRWGEPWRRDPFLGPLLWKWLWACPLRVLLFPRLGVCVE